MEHTNSHNDGEAGQRGSDSTPKAEPMAIVGMSCRLSGDVSSLEDFWQMTCRRRNGWSEIPEDRFSTGAYWHPNPARKGAFNPRGGYFLKQDPALFDAPFFNITRAEAEAMGSSPYLSCPWYSHLPSSADLTSSHKTLSSACSLSAPMKLWRTQAYPRRPW